MPREKWPIILGTICVAILVAGAADFFGYLPGAFEMLLLIFKGLAKAL